MNGLLDDEALQGAHEARITVRPERTAVPLPENSIDAFIETVRHECQLWGGAVAPILPLDPDGRIRELYRTMIPGSSVDDVRGLHPFALFDLSDARPDLSGQNDRYGSQLAAALLEYHKQEKYLPLEVVELDAGDPWRGIYAACLGLLPDVPDPAVLTAGNFVHGLRFEDFVRIERTRTTGSLEDLLRRIDSDEKTSPRRLSMVHLAYGSDGSSSIRTGRRILPDDDFARFDAGPNIVVLCSTDNVDDLTLLWNLRGAAGDRRPLPIGIPIEAASRELIASLQHHPHLARNGMPVNSFYVTSVSLGRAQIEEAIEKPAGGRGGFDIVPPENIASFGWPGGLTRDEVVVWDRGGSRIVSLPANTGWEVIESRRLGDSTRLYVDVSVLDEQLPIARDIRIDMPSGGIYGGTWSTWRTRGGHSDVQEIVWPGRLLTAKAVAAGRGFSLHESAPGRACRVLLTGLGSIYDIGNLIHEPLIKFLEEMAARSGFGWYKERVRGSGSSAPSPTESVGPTTDDLPERSFHDFKRVLGNNEKATKYWLLWAEHSQLIVKGFPLRCDACEAKQWTPVAAFAPPIVCRGCGKSMPTPFGDRPIIDFKYRISERLRQVFEQDALGHVLVARYFGLLFHERQGGYLVGLHPGMEIRDPDRVHVHGEADVLLFTRRGGFVPIEVKRSATGFTENEVSKLDSLAMRINAPWSALAVSMHGEMLSEEMDVLETRTEPGGPYRRLRLTYDHLLNPHPIWALSGDPFEWKPLDQEARLKREATFVATLANRAEEGTFDWVASTMLQRPDPNPNLGVTLPDGIIPDSPEVLPQ